MRGSRPAPSRRSRTSKSLTCVQGLALSLALAAELNGYPGPRHTVGLAKELDLNADQRDRIEALFAAMTAESIAIGEKLIAQETALDHRFANKTITPASLTTLVEEIGNTQATLRATHLKYHLSTLEVLTPAQAQRYSFRAARLWGRLRSQSRSSSTRTRKPVNSPRPEHVSSQYCLGMGPVLAHCDVLA
jgi:Spy/CpxP family protein refolding chaperone